MSSICDQEAVGDNGVHVLYSLSRGPKSGKKAQDTVQAEKCILSSLSPDFSKKVGRYYSRVLIGYWKVSGLGLFPEKVSSVGRRIVWEARDQTRRSGTSQLLSLFSFHMYHIILRNPIHKKCWISEKSTVVFALLWWNSWVLLNGTKEGFKSFLNPFLSTRESFFFVLRSFFLSLFFSFGGQEVW